MDYNNNGNNNYYSPVQNSAQYYQNQPNNLLPAIDSLAGWMNFMGIYTIVAGAITCLGIFTAIIGVPMIFAGIGLTKASSTLKSFKFNNNPYALNEVFANMNKYFKIQGIIIIVGLVMSVVSIALLLLFSAAAFNQLFY